MGLFDSLKKTAKEVLRGLPDLKAPVILVVNAERMTRSIAALVSGYQHFSRKRISPPCILDNVSGVRHRDKLVNAVESHCGIPVVGAVPSNPELTITERHLGLTPFRGEGPGGIRGGDDLRNSRRPTWTSTPS